MALAWALGAGSLTACSGGDASPSAPTATQTAPGTYTTQAFRPPLTYTLPAGWVVVSDSADYFAIRPVETDIVGVHVFRTPKAASQEADCPVSPATGVGTSGKELLAWIRGGPA